jgi:hypothetical protein
MPVRCWYTCVLMNGKLLPHIQCTKKNAVWGMRNMRRHLRETKDKKTRVWIERRFVPPWLFRTEQRIAMKLKENAGE